MAPEILAIHALCPRVGTRTVRQMSVLNMRRIAGIALIGAFAHACASTDDAPQTGSSDHELGMIRTAVLRLEDVGPGGAYKSAADLAKLRVIADYLYGKGVPFHVALIPRFIELGWDRDIAAPAAAEFRATLAYMRQRGASIGLHGYTHQFMGGTSGDGSEFGVCPFLGMPCSTSGSCAGSHGMTAECPPIDEGGDMPDYRLRPFFYQSWVSVRLSAALASLGSAGLDVDWFEAPHYHGSPTQRLLMEGWSGLIFEPRPYSILPQPVEPDPGGQRKTVFVADHDVNSNSQTSRGAVYVPAPLGYVWDQQPQASVTCIIQALDGATPMCPPGQPDLPTLGPYGPEQVAGVFFHPHIEMSFITLDSNNNLVSHDPGSPLHRLVEEFQSRGLTFRHVRDLTPFVPSLRNVNFAGSSSARVLVGDVDGDGDVDLIVYDQATGMWSFGKPNLTSALRPQVLFSAMSAGLQGWAVGPLWTPVVGDYNGDLKSDVAVMYTQTRQVQVALSDGSNLVPQSVAWLSAAPAGTVFSADVTGDGRSDLIFWNSATGTFRVAAARVTGGFSAPVAWLTGWAASTDWDVLFGNIDGLAGADIVVHNRQTGNWQVAVSVPQMSMFQPIPRNGQWNWLSGWAVGSAWNVRVADFDGDGYDDIAAVLPTNGTWQFAVNGATGFAPSPQSVFQVWGAGANSEVFISNFLPGRKASLMVRDRTLFGGTVDFATPSRQTFGLP